MNKQFHTFDLQWHLVVGLSLHFITYLESNDNQSTLRSASARSLQQLKTKLSTDVICNMVRSCICKAKLMKDYMVYLILYLSLPNWFPTLNKLVPWVSMWCFSPWDRKNKQNGCILWGWAAYVKVYMNATYYEMWWLDFLCILNRNCLLWNPSYHAVGYPLKTRKSRIQI